VTPMRIKLLPGGRMPTYATNGAAGMDCYASEGGMLRRSTTNFSGDGCEIHRVRVPLGFAIEIPDGYEGQLRPRSGLGLKHGLHVATGTIDHGYTGEVSALLYNLGSEPFTWKAGDRIAQLVIAPVARVQLVAVDELAASERGASGWGSSGVGELKVTK
jgi:dUTP pyrophosphatase